MQRHLHVQLFVLGHALEVHVQHLLAVGVPLDALDQAGLLAVRELQREQVRRGAQGQRQRVGVGVGPVAVAARVNPGVLVRITEVAAVQPLASVTVTL